MEICFVGVGQTAATFQAEEGVQPGMAVTLTGSGAVGRGADGALPCGVALGRVRGGAAAVQIGGAARVSYSGGAAPEAGWQSLVCDGAGGVRVSGSGGLSCLVLAVDTQARTAVLKL